MLLGATPIQTAIINQAEHCLSKCLYDDRCTSINANEERKTCELFDQDRCSPNVQWKVERGVVYYDLVGSVQCPPGKYTVKL